VNETPLVSVILTTYNRAHLLPRAINSVLNQTYQDFELIIVDDAAIDNTQEVVRSFKDSRIIYHKHEKNKGVLGAKNTGFDLARGRYCCNVDDDDELLPQALETAVNKLIELAPRGIRMVQFDCVDAETGKFSGSGIREEGYISYEDIVCERVHGDYWKVFDMNLLGDYRFDERLWGYEIILWLKLHRGSSSYHIPGMLYKAYRQHGEHISGLGQSFKNIPAVTLGRKAILQENGEDMRALCPKCYQQNLAGLGFFEILNDEKSAGRRTFRESFKYGFSLKHRIQYLSSFILNKDQIIALYGVYFKLFNIKQMVFSDSGVVRRLLAKIRAS
jgi:glycosyltransferase involved in cell wall biosynthesis